MAERPEKRRRLDSSSTTSSNNNNGTNPPTASSSSPFHPPSTRSSSSASQPAGGATAHLLNAHISSRSSDNSSVASVHVARGDTLQLDGYRDVKVMSVHYDDVVGCRAISVARGDQRVFLKFSLSAKQSVAAQFKAETALINYLRENGVQNLTKVIGREVTRLGTILIAQDENLELTFLKEMFVLKDRGPGAYWNDTTSLLRALEIFIKLIKVLASIHDLGVVHGSIRPTTVSCSIFSEVHVHDFSAAFRVSLPSHAASSTSSSSLSETAPIRERGMHEESLHYLAPECTGRISKAADYRSDYYSVGATFYEVLSGQTPFADTDGDPLSTIHAHIARRPTLVNKLDKSVPEALALIVAKLLEKSPDERYQTSNGLLVDLERVATLVRRRASEKVSAGVKDVEMRDEEEGVRGEGENGRRTPTQSRPSLKRKKEISFTVGAVDSAAHFQLPPASKMYGRDEPIKRLVEAFERVKAKVEGDSSAPAEVVIIKGPSGVGKTTLVDPLRKGLVQAKGFYTSVKFDQIRSPVPFFTITQAFSGLLRQLLSAPETELVLWRRRLSKALGKDARVLADVLPTLEHLFPSGWVDELPPVAKLGATESEERFQNVVLRVLRIFARQEKPLIVMFDDLQWCSPSDITFILSLLSPIDSSSTSATSSTFSPMLLVCLFRDNEVGPDHIVSTNLLPNLDKSFLDITLEHLTLGDVITFVSESLRTPTALVEDGGETLGESGRKEADPDIAKLSQLIMTKTLGSPLFIAQLLKSLNADGLFSFDFILNRWKYDLSLIASKSISTDVVQLLLDQMKKFSVATQTALKVASCIGSDEIEAITLAHATGRTLKEISGDLLDCVEEGLIVAIGSVPDGEDSEMKDGKAATRAATRRMPNMVPAAYRFFHDRCQQAAYSLIPLGTRSALHYEVGERLVASVSEDELQDQIFDFVEQLNHGIEIISTTDVRDRLAHYNYLAAMKASKSTAFEAARKYLTIAWDLLGAGGWVGQYDLMSKVTEALVEVEYSLTDYPAAQEFVRIFLDHSRDTVAKLRVYARSIRCATATGDSNRAIEIGQEGLALIGIDLPGDGKGGEKIESLIRDELALTIDSINALSELPAITDPIASGAQAILAALVPPVYFTRIEILGALSSLACRVTVQHGLDDAGAFMFTLHAVLIREKYGEPLASLAFGTAAVDFVKRNGVGTPLSCPTYKVYSSHVAVWHMSIQDTIPFFRKAVAYGIEFRDAEYVGFGCGELCSYSLLASVALPHIAGELDRFAVLVRKFRNELGTMYIGVIQQITLNLTGRCTDPCVLDGEAFNATDLQIAYDKKYATILHIYHMGRLIIAIIFGDREKARESAKEGRVWMHAAQGLLYPVFFQIFEAISFYDDYATLTPEQHAILVSTAALINKLADQTPVNFLTPKLWLQAEEARAKNEIREALSLYDNAIVAANDAQYGYISACLNERVASMLNHPKLGAGYLAESRQLYEDWGCVPKVAALDGVLIARLPPKSSSVHSSPRPHPLGDHTTPPSSGDDGQSQSGPSDPTDTDRSVSHRGEETPSQSHQWDHLPKRPSASSHGSYSDHPDTTLSEHRGSVAHSDVPSRSHLATELDLRTVVSASSVISSELAVDGVVSKLLALALRTAGAESCVLVLDKNKILCVEAIAKSDGSEVQHLRRTDSVDTQPVLYPCSVINYVARTRTMVVNNLDAAISGSDPYLLNRQPKSILCLALASQSRVIGVLYMENSQTDNAFTPDRLEILSLISGQAASTIEKARLVQDLKSANEDLKRSQAELEGYNRNLEGKVADRTLELRHKNDLLVAEVAEKERAQAEMRSAKDVAESATAMKSQFLANMSHEIRTPFNAVVALAGLLLDTQLNPVQTDYVETIKNSSQELLVVINDILDYSKIELDHLELSKDKVKIRSVIESSMDMLAERAASKSVEMALVLDQGDIAIIGDLTRLRQVVVNLLSNAVKFTSEGEIIVEVSGQRLPATASDEDPKMRVRIAVKDSGIGIAKENFNKLFRVYSQAEGSETTKVFGGTGLGLAISKKLSLLMGGDITVDSELGKGSTFTLDFIASCADSPEPEHDLYSPAQNLDLSGKRCLIVDENITSRKVVHQLLVSFGLTADAPDDSSLGYGMAVDAVQQGRPYDVIIVDAFLPGFAAQILLRRLRQKDINIPAIALTRMGSPIYDEMRKLDCHFLIKPIKRNRLHHTLREVFPTTEVRKASPPAPSNPVFPTNLAGRNPLSILTSEDNPINVKVITHLLKRLGYTTDVAEDGVFAVEKVQKKRYDIVFMDVNMPRMNGLEATRKIIELMPDASTRPHIVAMTANAMSGDKESCLAAGCDGYVSKPVLVPDLVSALNDAGAKSQRQRARLLDDGFTAPNSPIASNGSSSAGGANPFELELPVGRRNSRRTDSGGAPPSSTSS